MRSEIFDAYAKLAEEKGLVSTAAEEDSKIKDEDLYDVTPNEGGKHIMELAHPEPAVVSPAYDRLNGLVENNIERHNIMVNIIGRVPNGNVNYRKLAEKELVHELVRIANDLDNRGQDDLRVLADECISQLTKEGFAPVLIIGAVAAISFVSSILYNNVTLPSDQGIYVNVNKCVVELNKVVEQNISEGLKREVTNFMSNGLAPLQIATKNYWNLEPVPFKYDSAEDYLKVMNDPIAKAHLEGNDKITREYQKQVGSVAKQIDRVVQEIEGSEHRQFDGTSDTWETLKNLYRKVVHSDVREAADHLRTLKTSLDAAQADFQKVGAIAKSIGEKLEPKIEQLKPPTATPKQSLESLEKDMAPPAVPAEKDIASGGDSPLFNMNM